MNIGIRASLFVSSVFIDMISLKNFSFIKFVRVCTEKTIFTLNGFVFDDANLYLSTFRFCT